MLLQCYAGRVIGNLARRPAGSVCHDLYTLGLRKNQAMLLPSDPAEFNIFVRRSVIVTVTRNRRFYRVNLSCKLWRSWPNLLYVLYVLISEVSS